MRLTFGDVELDRSTYELRRAGRPVPIEPQAFDVLVYLIEHRERVVSKDELMDQVWGGRFVTESAVTSRIKQARRAIGDTGDAQHLIRTVHGRGYHFVAPVTTSFATEPEPAAAVSAPTETHDPPGDAPVAYTQSDGLAIAYQVTGGGPVDIVLVAGFVTHLEQDWNDPHYAHVLARLGAMGRLVRFDKRGTGMSDRPRDTADLETRIHDVLAVLDAAGSRRPYLVGYSDGGPMAALFAATHPERVAGLILYGAWAKRTRSGDYPWAMTEEERSAYAERLAQNWDWEADLQLPWPGADPATARWWARRSRAAATPTTVRALMRMNNLVDVRDALPAIRVPTLVLHRRGDRFIRVEEGRYLAEHIPHARLVELEGDDHFIGGNPDQILDPIRAFLEERPPSVVTTLALAAVVAIDGSRAEELAERLTGRGGVRRRTVEGRPLVLFDGPGAAVRAVEPALSTHSDCSVAIQVAELDRDAPVLGGDAIATAVRTARAAPPGRIVTTPTARDLLAGSGVDVGTLPQLRP